MTTKSQLQVLLFLSQYTPASDLDRDMITAFIEKRYRITPTTPIFAPQSTFSTIDTQSFLQWYESGYAASNVVKIENKLGILGSCSLTEANIVGILEENTVQPYSQLTPISNLSQPTDTDIETFLKALTASNLQLNPSTLSLEPKYIPQPNDKVRFYSYGFQTKGIGIVHEVTSQYVELYCYFIYPTKTDKAKLGYSMHERDIVNLKNYIFEPLLEGSQNSFINEDGISAYRRLKRELEKAGKVWRDKIHRIEPSQIKLDKGGTYWYINDKLKVVQAIEKETPTCQQRYLCGNYFTDHTAALMMLGKINEAIRDYLASPQWPNIEE